MGMPMSMRYRKNYQTFTRLSNRELEQLLGFVDLDIESRSIIEFILEKKFSECKPEGVKRLREILSENKMKEEDEKILHGFKKLFKDEYDNYTTEQSWSNIKESVIIQDPYTNQLNIKPSLYLDDDDIDIPITNTQKIERDMIRIKTGTKNVKRKSNGNWVVDVERNRGIKSGINMGVGKLFSDIWKDAFGNISSILKSILSKPKKEEVFDENAPKPFVEKPLWKRMKW